MRKKILLVFISIIFLQNTHAQSHAGQEAKLLATNTLFGGITTGLGAVINKPKEQKAWPAFVKGFAYGCAGGALLYTGKKFTNFICQDESKWVLGAWGGRLIHNAGGSVMENAALHRPVLSHYNLYIGFCRLELDWNQRFSASPKFMPATFAMLIYSLEKYDGVLKLDKSLALGNPYIISKIRPLGVDAASVRGNISVYEYSASNLQFSNFLSAHENVHTLQTQEYYVFNTYLNKPLMNLKSKSRFVNSVSRYIYLDFNLLDLSYALAKKLTIEDCYYKNPYEFEAERMALNRYIDWNTYCK